MLATLRPALNKDSYAELPDPARASEPRRQRRFRGLLRYSGRCRCPCRTGKDAGVALNLGTCEGPVLAGGWC